MEPNSAEYPTTISLREYHPLKHKGVLLPRHLLLQRMANLITLTETQAASASIVVVPDELDLWRD
jgi:hypothetical protein